MSIFKEIEVSDKKIRDFGIVMFVVLGLIVPFFISWKYDWVWQTSATWFLSVGLIFLFGGFFLKKPFTPLYKGWMAFAIVLGIIVSSLIISLVYYLMITPVGFLRRVFSTADPLQLKKSAAKESYWIPREQIGDKSRYEKLY